MSLEFCSPTIILALTAGPAISSTRPNPKAKLLLKLGAQIVRGSPEPAPISLISVLGLSMCELTFTRNVLKLGGLGAFRFVLLFFLSMFGLTTTRVKQYPGSYSQTTKALNLKGALNALPSS